MTIAIDPPHQKKFLALRMFLSIMKNDGNNTTKLISHNETMDFLFSHVPIMKEVEEYMQQTEKTTKKIIEQREALMEKGGLQI